MNFMDFMDFHKWPGLENRKMTSHCTIAFLNGTFLNYYEIWEGWERLKSGWRGSGWNLESSAEIVHVVSLIWPLYSTLHKKKWTLKLHRLKTTWIWSFMLMDQLSHNFEWWDIFGLIEIILLWIWGYLETMRAFFRFELETLTIILIETVVACTPC